MLVKDIRFWKQMPEIIRTFFCIGFGRGREHETRAVMTFERQTSHSVKTSCSISIASSSAVNPSPARSERHMRHISKTCLVRHRTQKVRPAFGSAPTSKMSLIDQQKFAEM